MVIYYNLLELVFYWSLDIPHKQVVHHPCHVWFLPPSLSSCPDLTRMLMLQYYNESHSQLLLVYSTLTTYKHWTQQKTLLLPRRGFLPFGLCLSGLPGLEQIRTSYIYDASPIETSTTMLDRPLMTPTRNLALPLTKEPVRSREY